MHDSIFLNLAKTITAITAITDFRNTALCTEKYLHTLNIFSKKLYTRGIYVPKRIELSLLFLYFTLVSVRIDRIGELLEYLYRSHVFVARATEEY